MELDDEENEGGAQPIWVPKMREKKNGNLRLVCYKCCE